MACMMSNSFATEFDAYKNDSHSSGLFRLLHIETVLRKKLPPTCERLVKTSQLNLDFSNCWPESDSAAK